MLTTLLLCLCLVTNIAADSITKLTTVDSNNISSSSSSLVDEELSKIGNTCMSTEDIELLVLPTWKPFNHTDPSEHELASATIEEYYNLKEPSSKQRSLNSTLLFERSVDTAVIFLDKRLPSMRSVFKRTFEEACPVAPDVLDKKQLDRMIELFKATNDQVYKAASKMIERDDCWDP